MSDFSSLIERIRSDVQCGGKMGQASALRMLNVMDEMASEIASLRRRVAKLETKT